jgi:hypothetical protein
MYNIYTRVSGVIYLVISAQINRENYLTLESLQQKKEEVLDANNVFYTFKIIYFLKYCYMKVKLQHHSCSPFFYTQGLS